MELVLPRNYVEIEQEEMMYLDGGFDARLLGRNLIVIGSTTWAGYLLVQAGKIVLKEARNGLTFWKAVARFGYAAKTAFMAMPLWLKAITTVGTVGTIWVLGTYEI